MCRHAGFRLLVRIAEEVRFPRDPIVLAFIWRSETRVSDPRGGILLLGSNQGKIPGAKVRRRPPACKFSPTRVSAGLGASPPRDQATHPRGLGRRDSPFVVVI